jgi:hypothetical protein
MAVEASAALESVEQSIARAVEEPRDGRPREVPNELHNAAERVARPGTRSVAASPRVAQ